MKARNRYVGRTLRSGVCRVVLTTAALATLASGCSTVEGTPAKAARPVKAVAVATTPAPDGIRYSATIEAFQEVSLAFKTSGYVDEIAQRTGADGRTRAAQAGDQIAKGTVLARVNEADYRERVNQGRAKLVEGEASLKKARLDLERAETLFAADSLTKPDVDAARANFDAAQARVVAAHADIELAESALHDCALLAPASGVLLERRIEIGGLVGAGSVGFRLGDVTSVKARFGIPDAMIGSVALGQRIGVVVDAVAGGAFRGRVTALAPTADPQSRVFNVEVTIPNGNGRLRPGMIGTVALGQTTAAAPPPLTVPINAVVKAAGGADQYAVLVVLRQGDVDIARLRPVTLGDVMGNGVAVLEGLAPGDRVIVTGASLLTDGDRVRIIPGT